MFPLHHLPCHEGQCPTVETNHAVSQHHHPEKPPSQGLGKAVHKQLGKTLSDSRVHKENDRY